MTLSGFGLARDPFDRDPEIDASCLPETFGALLIELRAGLRSSQGLNVVVGETGSGKSMLAGVFARELGDGANVALLGTGAPGLRHLLAQALDQFGAPVSRTGNEGELISALREFATSHARAGSATVVVIDDADVLTMQTLGRLGRVFSDDSQEPLGLHLFLFGRPELLDHMNVEKHQSVLQHLIQICRIDPLTDEESAAYLYDRIAAAGGTPEKIFSEAAVSRVVETSGGRTSRIEWIAQQSLKTAAADGDPMVTSAAVAAAAEAYEARVEEAAAAGETGEVEDTGEVDEAAQPQLPVEREGEEQSAAAGLRFGDSKTIDEGAGAVSEPAAGVAEPGDGTATARVDDGARVAGERAHAGRPAAAAAAVDRSGARVWLVGGVAAAAALALLWAAVSGDKTPRESAKAATVAPAQLAAASRGDRGRPPDALATAPKLVVSRDEKEGEAPAKPREPTAKLAKAAVESPALAATPAEAATKPSVPAVKPAKSAVKPSEPTDEPAERVVKQPESTAKPVKPAVEPPEPAAKSPEPAVKRPQPAAKPVATAKKAAATGKKYTVQVGAFRSKANAERTAAKLRELHFDASLVAGAGLYRVLSGEFSGISAARERERELGKKGFSTYVRDRGAVPR